MVEIDQKNLVEFDIEIKSSVGKVDNKNVSVNLIIREQNLSLSFPANYSNGTYEIPIPILNSMISEGQRDCELQVVCNDRFFIPWQGTIDLKESTKVVATPKVKSNINEEDTTITVQPRVRRLEDKKPIKEKSLKEDKQEQKEEKTIKPKAKKSKEKKNVVFEIVMDKPMPKKEKRVKRKKRPISKDNLSLGSTFK